MRVQVLLFVESSDGAVSENGGSLSSCAPKGFALVNHLWRENPPINLLKKTIPVVSPDEVNPALNAQFEMIEVWEDSVRPGCTRFGVEKLPVLCVDCYNYDFVKGLFPQCSFPQVEFNTHFKVNDRNPEYEDRVSALLGENLKSIEKLLASGVKISYRNSEGATLAHFAVERSSAALVPLLGKYKVDLDAVQNDGSTPLHIATIKMDAKMVGTLLDNGVNPDLKQSSGNTALHLAVKPKWKESAVSLVVPLLDKGAAVDIKTKNGWTPLHLAADAGYVDVVNALLQHAASIDSTIDLEGDMAGATPLHAALKKKRWEAAKILIEEGASLDARCIEGRNALYFAVNVSHFDTVDDILKRNSKKNQENKKAFYLAFRKDTGPEIVKRLIKSGFKVLKKDAKVPDVFFGAIHKNLFDLVEQLLDWGADVNQTHIFLHRKTAPMHVACKYADEKLVQLLLDHGANPMIERTRGETPVVGAVESGKLEIVKLLLHNHVSVRGQTNLLETALAKELLPLMELLLENGCQVKEGARQRSKVVFGFEPDWSASKMISMATLLNNEDIIDILMKYGARFDFQDVFFQASGSWQQTIHPDLLETFLAHGFFDLTPALIDNVRELFKACEHEHPGDFYVSENYLDQESLRMKRCGIDLARLIMKLDAAGKVGEDGAAGLVPKKYFKAADLSKLRKECEEELERIKVRTLCDTGADVTVFDVLMKKPNRVARYARNEDIRRAFDGYSFKEEFPHYGNIIDCCFRKGLWRREFLSKGVKAFNRLTCRLPTLPHNLKEDIVGFLTNHEIISLKMCFQLK